MHGLNRMQQGGRRSGAVKCGDHLLADMEILADAGDNHLAAVFDSRKNPLHRRAEIPVDAVTDFFHACNFNIHHFSGAFLKIHRYSLFTDRI